MVTIHTAGPGDYEAIYSMAGRVWPQTYKKILSEEQVDYMFAMMYSREAFEEQIAIKNHHYLIAKEDGELLGFASYEVNYRSETTKIHKIYVVPEVQGRGAGTIMMDKIAGIAKKHGNDKLSLNVNRYNTAVRFYENIGFVKAGEENIDIGNNYLMEDFIMVKGI